MAMSVNTITSQSLIPIEEHFRVSAGPGAGKTYWLINHIANVLQHSKRLGNFKKVACITYTNVAVDTIIRRMPFVAGRVEVSTIHSFLYANIVKPYMSFIAAEHGFDVKKMDGHDDHIAGRKKIKEWLETHSNIARLKHPYSLNQLTRLENNMQGIRNWLQSLYCELRPDGTVTLKVKNSEAYYIDGTARRMLSASNCLDKLSLGLMDYKKLFWAKGIMHHDDVLFFSYLLLQRYPFILEVIRAKFPYFFIDEFQDTSPLQEAIIKKIGAKGTIVGIIGDVAQSIYSFQGAAPSYFTNFSLPGIKDYLIEDNRRSTTNIVDLLNALRSDIQQSPIRSVAGEPNILYVGDVETALSTCNNVIVGDLTVLSRNNITANAMKRQMSSSIPANDLVRELGAIDESKRRGSILSSLNAMELVQQKRFKEAIREMEKNFYSERDKTKRKKVALAKICLLSSLYDTYRAKPLYEFYELVKLHISTNITKLTRGAARNFYDTYTYEQVAVCITLPEDSSPSRTIHKAKGDEFDNVLVVLKQESDLGFTKRTTLSTEEDRVLYVALSRAKERLFVAVPTLKATHEDEIKKLFKVERLS